MTDALFGRGQAQVDHVAEAGGPAFEEIDGQNAAVRSGQSRSAAGGLGGRKAAERVDFVLIERRARNVVDDAVDDVPVLRDAIRKLKDAHVVGLDLGPMFIHVIVSQR